jgi:hypothetical protein
MSVSSLRQNKPLSTDERLAFERLLSEITVRCTNLTPEEMAPTIVDALREVAEFLGADRCVIYEYFEDADVFHPTLHGFPKEDSMLMQEMNDWAWGRYPYVYEALSYVADLWKRDETLQVFQLDE